MQLLKAKWTDHLRGLAYFSEDCVSIPKLKLIDTIDKTDFELCLSRVNQWDFAKNSGYFLDKKHVNFVLFCENYKELSEKNFDKSEFFVFGTFNNWGHEKSVNWKMSIFKENVYVLKIPMQNFSQFGENICFKFFSDKFGWLNVPKNAENIQLDNGIRNFVLSLKMGGNHCFLFEIKYPLKNYWYKSIAYDFSDCKKQACKNSHKNQEIVPIDYKDLLLSINSDKKLGAIVEKNRTTFRIFVPRAEKVTLFVKKEKSDVPETIEMTCKDGCVWETSVAKNLANCYYYYSVNSGLKDNFSNFDSSFKILDPYALATVSREGPGVIIDRNFLKIENDNFTTPEIQDLIILECHVRDIIAKEKFAKEDSHMSLFGKFSKWLSSKSCYIKSLGVNAIEFQPIQTFDSQSENEYHWGYMPVNYFCLSNDYSSFGQKIANSLHANGISRKNDYILRIQEFQKCVKTCHENELAVIIDVVYNHVGNPNHLLFLDKLYYFECTSDGHLMNYSGCGNDLRTDAQMVRRLVIDSLVYWVETFKVDGFRFDLGELLGIDLLVEIETVLKKINPKIILIAEPWSFRGHIGLALKETGFSQWNDGFREFLANYIWGNGNQDGIEYFIRGSLGHLTKHPFQTLNYTESHDDMTWIDRITENTFHSGHLWTKTDQRRTHLMFSILLISLGIPMISAGQDFLRSKKGTKNTYQNGELNAIEYNQMFNCPKSHEYVANWIAFRKSTIGRLLRLKNAPSKTYFKSFKIPNNSAIAILFNADNSLGKEKIFFAINPHLYSVEFEIDEFDLSEFVQIADHERFARLSEYEMIENSQKIPDHERLSRLSEHEMIENSQKIADHERFARLSEHENSPKSGLLPPVLEISQNKFRLPELSCALWIS